MIMEVIKNSSGTEVILRRGSLLDQGDVESIVNAQNCHMRGGNGINGAIHAKAGVGLMAELEKVAPRGCMTGGVKVTSGFNTGFRYIFHTPGPIWEDGFSGEYHALASCYTNVLSQANRLGVESVGFCSISTGIFRFPLEEAAGVALKTVKHWLSLPHDRNSVEKIVFAMFGEEEYDVYSRKFDQFF
jgi:O-acetyl-ADP-ribose deacetylase (regulator of RNase III)